MIPDGSNVFGIIHSPDLKEEVVKKFEAYGWMSWKAGWVDWEIKNDYSEFVIEGDKEILIHGPVATDHFDILIEKMKEMGLIFSMEFYDDNENMVMEVKN